MITIKDGADIDLPAGRYRFTTDPKKRGIRIARIQGREITPGDTDAEHEPQVQREPAEAGLPE